MKLSTLVLLVPVSLIAAMIAVANRADVAFTLVPFLPQDSGFTFVMPLFLLVFAAFLIGVVVGAVTVALSRARRRGRRRVSENDVAKAMMTNTTATAQPPSAERLSS